MWLKSWNGGGNEGEICALVFWKLRQSSYQAQERWRSYLFQLGRMSRWRGFLVTEVELNFSAMAVCELLSSSLSLFWLWKLA
jgi:hypothetical protein